MGLISSYVCDSCHCSVGGDEAVLTINWSHPRLGGSVLTYGVCCVSTILGALPGVSEQTRTQAQALTTPETATPGG